MREIVNWIDNKHQHQHQHAHVVSSDSGSSIPVTSPATGEVIATVSISDTAAVNEAVQSCKKAFENWR